MKTRPERRNAVKVLLLLDIGGSMDDHVQAVEDLFSAARAEFKHMEHFYFHNCLYEFVWRDNARRWTERLPTWDLLRSYGSDWKCIFVGDAAMSPYEIALPGGANEHWNEEAGQVLAAPRPHAMARPSVDQPRAGRTLALHAIDPDDFADLRRPYGPDDIGRHRAGREAAGLSRHFSATPICIM